MPVHPPSSVEQILEAFEIANVEALMIGLPEATILGLTTATVRKWNCTKSDIINRNLVKYGTGVVSARFLEISPPDNNPTIEVTYASPVGDQRASVFRQQRWTIAERDVMLLIGQQTSVQQANEIFQNEQRLKIALQSGGYALWDYDFTTGQTYNSPEMYDIMGVHPNSHKMTFQSFNERLHPDDVGKSIDEKIKSAPFGAEFFQTRYRVRHANGAYMWIESIAGLMRDPSTGKTLKCVGLCRNVNDQMLALERLRTSERNLKRTQELAMLGSFWLRVDTGLSGLSRELAHLIGLRDITPLPSLSDFISMIEPTDAERFSEGIELAKLGRMIADLEIAVRIPAGEVEYFQCTIEPDRNAAGEVETLFGSCQRVTDRKALERKFLQAQKMETVGQLTGGVAHDFNNLLMVVIGNLQLVEQLVIDDPRALKRIRAALEAADKGSDLTKRMLAFSRQQTLQNTEITVNSLILKMEDMLKQALSASVELKIIANDSLWPIKADSTMLETAILNLALNAGDAMKPNGGTLIIETANRSLDQAYAVAHEDVTIGDYVEIAVTDTGSGIPADNLEKVFQPFFTTKGPEAGSGLGLSMIYGFVKQSAGHVKIYSEVGYGTTVKLYLPRLKHSKKLNAATLTSHDAVPDLGNALQPSSHLLGQLQQLPADKRFVLVVEDNPAVREIAAAMIEDMGFKTLVAATGHEGLEIIKSNTQLALVLSDVIMAGGMNGPELAVEARKIQPDIRVLFMSGYAPGSVRQMQDLPDTVELVNKPFTRADLTEKVQRALAA